MSKRKQGWETKYVYRFDCPFCGATAALYHIQKKICKCLKCEEFIQNKDLPDEVKPYIFEDYRTPEVLQKIEDDHPSTYPPISSSEEGISFLRGRNVFDTTKGFNDIKYQEGYVYFPLSATDKKYPIEYVGRNIYKKRYINPQGLKKDARGYCFGWKDLKYNKLLITEGVFDILANDLLGYGISLLGTSLGDTLFFHILDRFNEVLLWLDPDAQDKAIKLQKQFQMYGFPCKRLESSVDAGDFRNTKVITKLKEYIRQ